MADRKSAPDDRVSEPRGAGAAMVDDRESRAWTVDESVSANEENELATIRVRTMYGLVEEIQVAAGATDALTRVLYLTNMQAQLFKAETVPKMMQAFEARQPSLVINLMEGSSYPIFYEKDIDVRELSEQERADWSLAMPHNILGSSDSFASRAEAAQATRHLANFFKEVLLPLAAETNAVILCSAKDTDILSATMTEVLPLFAARYGGQLPFTVFGIAPAANFAWQMLKSLNSLASELAMKSKNWHKGIAKIEAAATKDQGEEAGKWIREDVQPGLGNYIIIECVSGKSSDRWHEDRAPLVTFQNELLQALASQLPVLCVRTGGSNRSVPVTANVQLASRDIPVLIVDPQPRPSLGVTINPADPTEQEHFGALSLEEQEAEKEAKRDALITAAIEANTARHEELWALGKVQSYDQHDLAYFFDVLNDDGNSATTVTVAGGTGAGDTQSLYESLKTAEKLKATGDDAVAYTPAQLESVINHLVEMMAQTHFRALPAAEQAELQQKEGFTPMNHFASKMETIWGVYYDVFKSRRLYGANLEDLEGVKTLIDQIVKRDRLPSNNSIEAQQSLRDAWNTIDVCVYNAAYYKLMAKATFVLCLLLGTLVIVLTVFKDRIDEAPVANGTAVDNSDEAARKISETGIFLTASLLTMVTAVITFYDPARRWRELRAIAENMQSDIFAFRSRTGAFIVDRAELRRPEQLFVRRIQDSRSNVVQLAGLTESSFLMKYPSHVYRHGQNDGSSVEAFEIHSLSKDAPIHMEDGTHPDGRVIDNHHSPMKPDQYVRARLVPLLDFYQSRVPDKYREHRTTVFLSLATTSSIAILSYLSGRVDSNVDLTAVAGVVSGVAAAITAWQSESGANKKINRYTNAVVALKNHLMWWNQLTPVDQNSQTNINTLVSVTEDIKLTEVNAWAASRQQEPDRIDQTTQVGTDVQSAGRKDQRKTGDGEYHSIM